MLRLLEECGFWMFLSWPIDGKWPSLAEAKVTYRERVISSDVPLSIDGFLVNAADDFDRTIRYEIRPEASPDSEALFTAELRWVGQDLGLAAVDASTFSRNDEFLSIRGTFS